MILKVMLYALTGYIGLCAIVFMFQRKMLYMPGKVQLSEEQALAAGLRYWPTPENFQGFVTIEEPENVLGTVIVFHGNAGAAYDRFFYANGLARQNMRVILAEYPGYGGRDGQPCEDVLVKDALKTIQLAFQEFGGPLYVWGESLGCGVGASAIQRTDIPVEGAVLFLPWDSLPRVAKTHYWYLPVHQLIKDRYNSVENLKGFKEKVAVILAGNDEIIPIVHGRKLYDSLSTEKRLWVFEGATHNEMPIEPDLAWWEEVVTFISK